MTKRPYSESKLSNFIEKRILALRGRKSQLAIASEAGFVNPNMISMIKSGATRLPLDRVPALAVALECDARHLLLLALGQDGDATTAKAFAEILGTVVTHNEVAWLEELRDASDGSDPALTKRSRAVLRAIFGK